MWVCVSVFFLFSSQSCFNFRTNNEGDWGDERNEQEKEKKETENINSESAMY